MAFTPKTCKEIIELSYLWAGGSSWFTLNTKYPDQMLYNAGLTVSGIYTVSSASTYAVSRMPSFQTAIGKVKHRYISGAIVASNLLYTVGVSAYCSKK